MHEQPISPRALCLRLRCVDDDTFHRTDAAHNGSLPYQIAQSRIYLGPRARRSDEGRHAGPRKNGVGYNV